MSWTRAIIDNTSFAGVMRLYKPDIPSHSAFWRDYPGHKEIDRQSLADFLTAIVVYGMVILDASSYDRSAVETSGSWVRDMLQLLPLEVRCLVSEYDFKLGRLGPLIDEETSCRKAVEIMLSPLRATIPFKDDEKIPNVYKSNAYLHRPLFERLNEEHGGLLSETELVQAMFLHRGIFLQARAHAEECVYLPYHYRGAILSNLPPLIWIQEPVHEGTAARLPLSRGRRPTENEYTRQLNAFYFEVLKSVIFETDSENIPFIGSAILAMADEDPERAFKIALDLRTDGGLKETLSKFRDAAGRNDKIQFDRLVEGYRSQLRQAARHLGATLPDEKRLAFYKLATSVVPKQIEAIMDSTVALLPSEIRTWGRQTASTLLTKSSLQLLFLGHAAAATSMTQRLRNFFGL